MANEHVNDNHEILGIDKVSGETRRVRTNADGEIIVEAKSMEVLIGEVQPLPTTNTLLARLKSLEDKIDNITSGSTPATTTLTGSSPGTIPEYGWLDTDNEPTPLEPTKFAMGVEINTTTHAMTTKYWNGTAWVEVL